MQLTKSARLIIILFTLSVLLQACTGGKKANRNKVNLPQITVGSNTANFRVSAPRIWDITHTKVALGFNILERTANGEAWVSFKPYNPFFMIADSVVLDAQSMKIEQVSLTIAGNTTKANYKYKDNKLIIQLPSKEHTYMLYIKYTAMPYATSTGGSKAITDDRGLYFVNHDNKIPNKPVQIWTQGETEANSHWMPTIDKPNERFTFELELTVPDSFVTLSNGALVEQKKLGNGLRKDMWSMEQTIQPYVATFAIGNYAIVKDKWNGKEVNYYVEHAYEPYARDIFKNTPEMLTFFSSITGVPYPWNKYSQIVVRDYVSGAMENTTASTFGEFVNQNAREIADKNYEDVVSHELFHQWFGDYVTAESWSNITLNESFANYGEQLWRNYKYGAANAQELAFDDLNSYLGSTKDADPALLRHYYSSKEDVFDRVSYQKGGAILHYLHGLIGDSAFYKAMNIYLTQNALKPAEVAHWRLAVEEATGLDWNWFFNQWYKKGGHPELNIAHDYDDENNRLTVRVHQDTKSDVYRLPMYSLLVYGNDVDTVYWDVDSRDEFFSYPYKNGVKPLVVADINHWIVGVVQETKPNKYWLQQYKIADNQDLLTKLYAYKGLHPQSKKANNSPEAETITKLALNDVLPYIRNIALVYFTKVSRTADYIDTWKDKVEDLAKNDPNNQVRATAITTLAKWKQKQHEEFYRTEINSQSYMVGGAALAALYTIDNNEAYEIAKKMLKTDPRGDLKTAIWGIISAQAKGDDIKLFQDNVYNFMGGEKIAFAGSLADYLQYVRDEDAFNNGLKLFKKLLAVENIKSYRQGIALNLFALAFVMKDNKNKTANKDEKAILERRLELIKQTANEIIAMETEEENIREYETYFKYIFGSNNLKVKYIRTKDSK